MHTNNPNIPLLLSTLTPDAPVEIDGTLYKVVGSHQDLDNPTVVLTNGKRAYRLDPLGSSPHAGLRLQTAGGRGKPVNRLVSSIGCWVTELANEPLT